MLASASVLMRAPWSQQRQPPPCRVRGACSDLRRSLQKLIDGRLRQIDASDQPFTATKWRGRWTGANADAATGAQIGVDLCHLATPHATSMRNHRHCGVGAIVKTTPAAVAVRRIDDGDRHQLALAKQRQHRQHARLMRTSKVRPVPSHTSTDAREKKHEPVELAVSKALRRRDPLRAPGSRPASSVAKHE